MDMYAFHYSRKCNYLKYPINTDIKLTCFFRDSYIPIGQTQGPPGSRKSWVNLSCNLADKFSEKFKNTHSKQECMYISPVSLLNVKLPRLMALTNVCVCVCVCVCVFASK